MSRIGLKEIEITNNIKAAVVGSTINFEGPKGKLSSPVPNNITASLAEGKLTFSRVGDDGPTRAAHGLARALAANCVLGVTQGFEKKLQIIWVGHRVNISKSSIELHLGYSHPIDFPLPKGITATKEEDRQTKSTILTITGIDKQLVGQVAANIRRLRKPEPYKGKGIRYLGEQILRKAGKSGK